LENDSPLNQSKSRRLALFLLIITTILWGSSFIITKNLVKEMPIFFYLGLRFLIALLGFSPFFIKLKTINKKILIFGSFSGVIYFIAIAFQTYGLAITSAGKAGFITGISTVIVPFLAWIILKKKIKKIIFVSVALSIIGLSLLMLNGDEGINIGDMLVLVCAFLFAVFIVLNDKYVKLVDILLYTIVQLIIIVSLCFLFSIALKESFNLQLKINFWFIMLYLAFIVTALTFYFQNWSQKFQESSETAIIFTLEPVFAVIFASFLIGNEKLSIQIIIGCVLIFTAIFLISLKSSKEK